MKLDTFIKRPILAGVISVLIVLVGILGLTSLPIEQYPDIAPPTVSVSTSFYGADAQTIIKSVITPLEENINGVENMLYMKSTASNNGQAEISVVFKQGTNPDMATVNVQNRVQKALSVLPAEVKQVGVTVEKQQNSMLQIIAVYSPDDTYDYTFLSNFASINIRPKVMRVNGVGKFQMFGSEYSMRVWMDPQTMAEHHLVPEDIAAALATQNIEAATGSFGENSDETFQYSMRYTGRLRSIEEFNQIVLRVESDGSILRLGDVAKVELDKETTYFSGEANGHPGVLCVAYQAAGSNATQVNEEIAQILRDVEKEAPSGLEIITLMNTNDFLFASLEQVVSTLRDALILVILVVLLFLKDFRSTLIPFISIMVSLIGTFAFMMVAGFSINLLTLFALVLVIGTVCDDSIVVVEAVHSKFEEGILSPAKATSAALSEISTAVITSSLVFMAVFVPVSFMGGTSGVFYRQFGLTMAVAVGISAINALTTVPALCSLLLKPLQRPVEGKKPSFKQKYAIWFDGFFEKFSKKYQGGLDKVINHKGLVWIVACAGAGVLIFSMATMAKGLVPEEDKGLLIVEATLPPGSSLHSTSELLHNLQADLAKIDGVANMATTAGYGFVAGSNAASGIIILQLKPWGERSGESSYANIYKHIGEVTAKYENANCIVFSTPMIPGYGTSNGIDMYVQDKRGGTTEELYDATQEFLSKIAADGLYGYSAFNMDYPQWEVSVNVAKCMKAGLSPKEVLGTMSSYYGGAYVSDLNLYSKVYKVMLQGTPDSRRDEFSLDQTYVRTADDRMAPLSNFVSIKRVYGPDSMVSFNKYPSINVSVNSTMATGKALDILQKDALKYLPDGYGIDFAGMSREQNSQGGLELILLLCTFIIYLILAALYESLVIPIAVLMAVPLGLAGSYAASSLVGLDNNIYLQTGVIMLIGLLAKTAILITEYAAQRHEQGLGIKEAAVDAAGARLRPIMMTAGTMVIGLLPLITSVNGVGGMGNFSLGLGTTVGMIIGTVGLLYITPALFTTFQKIQDKIKPAQTLEDEK